MGGACGEHRRAFIGVMQVLGYMCGTVFTIIVSPSVTWTNPVSVWSLGHMDQSSVSMLLGVSHGPIKCHCG